MNQRILILCTHNSARSQMAEALVRRAAERLGAAIEVHSAGTVATNVKPQAQTVMAELGLDLSGHRSKTLADVPQPQHFDYVITVCESAAQQCPVYPARTQRRHYPFIDPSGAPLACWREVRGQLAAHFEAVVEALASGEAAPPSYHEAPAITAC